MMSPCLTLKDDYCSRLIDDNLHLVIYDWFERENSEQDKYHGHQYKLGLTKQQYDQMKTLVLPMGMHMCESN